MQSETMKQRDSDDACLVFFSGRFGIWFSYMRGTRLPLGLVGMLRGTLSRLLRFIRGFWRTEEVEDGLEELKPDGHG